MTTFTFLPLAKFLIQQELLSEKLTAIGKHGLPKYAANKKRSRQNPQPIRNVHAKTHSQLETFPPKLTANKKRSRQNSQTKGNLPAISTNRKRSRQNV